MGCTRRWRLGLHTSSGPALLHDTPCGFALSLAMWDVAWCPKHSSTHTFHHQGVISSWGATFGDILVISGFAQ